MALLSEYLKGKGRGGLLVGFDGGPFNPLRAGSPYHAFWTGDPDWTPPADGAEVTSWRNAGSCGVDAVTNNTGPTYDEDGFNGAPTLVFNGSQTLAIAEGDTDTLTQAGTIITVCAFTNVGGGTKVLISGQTATTRWQVSVFEGDWRQFAGNTHKGSTADTDNHVRTDLFNGSSSEIFFEGVSDSVGNAGSYDMDGLVIGGNHAEGGAFVGRLSLLLAYGDDVTGEAWYAKLIENLVAYYSV